MRASGSLTQACGGLLRQYVASALKPGDKLTSSVTQQASAGSGGMLVPVLAVEALPLAHWSATEKHQQTSFSALKKLRKLASEG